MSPCGGGIAGRRGPPGNSLHRHLVAVVELAVHFRLVELLDGRRHVVGRDRDIVELDVVIPGREVEAPQIVDPRDLEHRQDRPHRNARQSPLHRLRAGRDPAIAEDVEVLLDLAGVIGMSGADGLRQVDDGTDKEALEEHAAVDMHLLVLLALDRDVHEDRREHRGNGRGGQQDLVEQFHPVRTSGSTAMAPMSQITGCSASRLVEAT